MVQNAAAANTWTYHGHAGFFLVRLAQLARYGALRLADVIRRAAYRYDAVGIHGWHLLHAAVDKRIRARHIDHVTTTMTTWARTGGWLAVR